MSRDIALRQSKMKRTDKAITDIINILYIAHERMLGGASLSLVTLADEMQKRGNRVGVVVPFYFSPVARELRRRKIKTYWVFFGWWMMPKNWPFLMKFSFRCLYAIEGIAARIIAGIVKREGYQIIHSNSSVIDVGSKAAELAGIRHVWHFREFGDLDYELYFLRGKKQSFEEIRKRNDKIVFISQSLKRHYSDLKLQDRTGVIYNGVDIKYLNYHEHQNDRIIFLISGNLHRNKRQDLVLEAAHLLQEWRMSGFEIWVAGGAGSLKSSSDYEKELKDYIEVNRLENVKMLGRISDMNGIRSKADVEIVASKQEAFGRVTVEAMLSANPVMASDSGANPELVREGETGWLFESGNALALAEKMKYVIENYREIQRMGNYAYKFAKTRFLSEKNTEQIEALYKELL